MHPVLPKDSLAIPLIVFLFPTDHPLEQFIHFHRRLPVLKIVIHMRHVLSDKDLDYEDSPAVYLMFGLEEGFDCLCALVSEDVPSLDVILGLLSTL